MTNFEYGDNTVAAKISIDVPQEGIQGLREITQEVERFRTTMEAATRAEGDFIKYLQQLPAIASQAAAAQKNLVDQLERTIEAQHRLGGGGDSITKSGVQPGPAPRPEQTPREYLNTQAQQGKLRPGDVPAQNDETAIHTAAEKHREREKVTQEQAKKTPSGPSGIEKGMKQAEDVMGSMGRGGTNADIMKSMSAAMKHISGSIPSAAGEGAVGSGLAEAVGAGGEVLGGAAAGLLAFEKGGNVVQGMRSMGQIQGGGAKEGLADEANIRMMALNPFITTEQSRQIIQGALTGGYKGQQFDTVTQFVASNLKDMNMQVSDSFDLVQKNVRQGGQSIQDLAMDLGTLKDMTKDGAMSMPQAQQAFKTGDDALMAAGGSGAASSAGALQAAAEWKDNPALVGQGTNNMVGLMGSPAGASLLRTRGGVNIPAGITTPKEISNYLSATGQMAQASSNVFKGFAQQAWQQAGSPPKSAKDDQSSPGYVAYIRAVSTFQQLIARVAPGDPIATDESIASQEFDSFIYDKTDPGAAARDSVAKTVKQQTTITKPSAMSAFGRGFATSMNFDAQNNGVSGASNRIEALDTLQKATSGGMDNIDVLNEKGDVVKLNMSSDQQAQAMASGAWKVRAKGTTGPGQTLADVASHGGQLTGTTGGSANVTGQLTVTVDQQGRIGVSPNPVPLAGNKRAANAGAGTAAVNTPGAGS